MTGRYRHPLTVFVCLFDALALPTQSLILMILSRLRRVVAGSARNVPDVCRAAEAHRPFNEEDLKISPRSGDLLDAI